MMCFLSGLCYNILISMASGTKKMEKYKSIGADDPIHFPDLGTWNFDGDKSGVLLTDRASVIAEFAGKDDEHGRANRKSSNGEAETGSFDYGKSADSGAAASDASSDAAEIRGS